MESSLAMTPIQILQHQLSHGWYCLGEEGEYTLFFSDGEPPLEVHEEETVSDLKELAKALGAIKPN